ncbi:MAG: hypothetical protein CMI28_03550 [Opitutae bacterium]|nr:hypothetical protein [Opitutae bacterium]
MASNLVKEVFAKVVPGFGIASGKARDDRFPHGSVAEQMPHFRTLGLNLDSLHYGTINLDIHPCSYELLHAEHYFPGVKWTEHLPPENFSFFPCKLTPCECPSAPSMDAYVYWPHPSTKPEFFQSPTVLEIIAPFIPLLDYGSTLKLKASNNSMRFLNASR